MKDAAICYTSLFMSHKALDSICGVTQLLICLKVFIKNRGAKGKFNNFSPNLILKKIHTPYSAIAMWKMRTIRIIWLC